MLKIEAACVGGEGKEEECEHKKVHLCLPDSRVHSDSLPQTYVDISSGASCPN